MTWEISLLPHEPKIRIGEEVNFTTQIIGTVSGNVAYIWYVNSVAQEDGNGIDSWFDFVPSRKGVFMISVYAADHTPSNDGEGTYVTVKGPFGRKGRLYGR